MSRAKMNFVPEYYCLFFVATNFPLKPFTQKTCIHPQLSGPLGRILFLKMHAFSPANLLWFISTEFHYGPFRGFHTPTIHPHSTDTVIKQALDPSP